MAQAFKIIRFWTEFRNGRDPLDMIEFAATNAITLTGDITHTAIHRVRDIMHTGGPLDFNAGESERARAERWAEIAPAYAAWKSQETLPEHGTPLAAWAALSKSQADVLKASGLLTVEAVADLPDSLLGGLRLPGARSLRDAAKSWLSGRTDAAKDERIAALEAQIASLAAAVEASAKPAKPARTPRKSAAAEIAAALGDTASDDDSDEYETVEG